jgi:hypothetical protein
MKTLSTLFITLLFVAQSFAGEWTNIRSAQPVPGQKILVSSNIDESTIHFRIDGYNTTTVLTPQGPAVVISLDGATQMLLAGAPDLPKMTASVIIPDLAQMKIEVLSADYQDFGNVVVAPSKGNLTRDIDPSGVPYSFGKEYGTDQFFPGTLSGAREPYIIRDYRGQTVIAYPFQYNPITRTLRVYTDITVKISKINDLGQNQLVRTEPLEKIDADFSHIYRHHFLNAAADGSRYTPVTEYGNMVIISYGAFLDAIQPYADWKKQIGYPVEIVDVGSIGNSSAIKSFIANYYDNKGLTFVLLVGDAAQVPSSSTSAGDSDNNYSYVAGSDHYPDLFVGRFSAENVEQVETQVQKTLMYEQNPPVGADWFSICTGIGSDQGPGDDNEYDYQHIRNIGNNKLLPFTYTYANELFDGTQGGNDQSGNPTPTDVANVVNAGTGIINYTGHGSDGSWGTTGFSISDVNNLTNSNLLPFIWSVACVNGNFVSGTCFAEAWLRATKNNQPTGAVAFLGSTINQSWDPPMVGEDEMDDILVETYPDNICRTFGALSMNGCMQMNDEFGSGGDEMTDTWTCFGDPSLMVRTAMPQTMTVIHDPVLFIGATQMTVLCDAEGARATLSLDGTRLCTGVVEDGSVVLTFAPLNNIGTVTLTITGFNYLPYISDIEIIPASGPYVVMDTYQINDEGGNNNGLADYDEDVNLGVSLKNVGIVDATNVTVTLSTSDPYITITDFSEIYPLIPAGQTVSIENGFAFSVSSDVPDQHQVTFTLTSESGELSWQSMFIINTNAPILHINSLTIDDSQGNGDGELDPGETASITINYSNTGHATAYDIDILMEGQSGFINIADPMQNFASIGFFGVFTKTFAVTVDENTPEGINIDFLNEMTMGNYLQDRVFLLKISALVEDFETGDYSKFNWQMGGNAPWTITFTYPYEGYYSIKSGVITHSQTSEISIAYNVMADDSIIFFRKVSSESSDVLKFYINNQAAGSWSGTTGGWKREAFAVTAGMKTFKWSYEKNNIGSGGSDCAWLDYIVFPSPMSLTIWAGPDDQVCSGNTFDPAEAYGTDYASVEWATSGTGTFDNNTSMQPLYSPSAQDLAGGSVVLTLNLWDDLGNEVSDDMALGFEIVPGAPELPQGPAYVDLAQEQVSVYSTTGTEGATSYAWHLEPAEAGVVIASHLTATVNWNSNFMGIAYLSVAGNNECGDGDLSEAIEIQVDNTLVSIPENNSASLDMIVYPNPSSGDVNIRINGGDADVVLQLMDATGRVTKLTGSGIPGTFRLQLRSGIYLLVAESNGNRVTRKLIIN